MAADIAITADKFYPNPTSNEVTFVSEKEFGKDENMELYDVFGSLVKIISLPEKLNQISFSLENLSEGIYFTTITSSARAERKTGKLVMIK